MFQSSKHAIRAWWSRLEAALEDASEAALAVADAALVGAPEAADDAAPPDALHLRHPHRRTLRWKRQRRPGTVPAAPAHCLSPVRSGRPVSSVSHQA